MRFIWDDSESDDDGGTICVTDTPTSDVADVFDMAEVSSIESRISAAKGEIVPLEEPPTPIMDENFGRIKELVLHNFKSYDGKVRICEFSKFTAIIGPNGCGKSNLMDAISFVLCISSTVLRGLNLKDLIHKPSHDRREPITDAYVELVLNGTHRPVTFRRQIHVSGTVSYYMDGESITFKQYKEHLREYRINTLGSTGLIFQGAVNDIATRSPAELTRLFETISGSSLYAKPYRYIKEKLERCRMEYRNLVSRKRSVQQELRHYRSIISTNVDYDEMLSQYKHAEARKYAYDFHLRAMKFASQKTEYERLTHQAAELNKRMSHMQDKRAELEHQRSGLYFEQSQLHRKLQEKQQVVLSKKDSMSKFYDTKSSLEKRISELDTLRDTLESDMDSLQRELEELCEQESHLKEECQSLESEMEKMRTSYVTLTPAQRQQYDGLLQSFNRTTSAMRIKLNLGRNKLVELTADRDRVRNELDSLRKYHSKLVASSKPHDNMYQGLCTRLRETDDSIELLSMTKSRLEHERSQVTARKTTLQEEKDTLDNHLRTLNVAKVEYRQILRRRQYTQELISSISGVHGEVLSLCEITNACYHDGIMAALGTRGHTIVTDNLVTIQECITKLRRDKVFKRDFLPLDSLNPSKSDYRTRLLDLFRSRGVRVEYKLAIDCLVYHRRYGSLFEYLLGDTLLVPTMEDAEILIACDSNHSLGFNVVTQKGQVITRDRTIILDSAVYSKNSQLELELAEFSRLSLKSERLDQDIQLLSKKLTGIQNSLQDTLDRLQKHYRAKDLLKMKVDFARNHKEASDQQLCASQEKIAVISTRLSALEKELEALNKAQENDESIINNLQRTHFEKLNTELGVEDVHGLLTSGQDSVVRLSSTLEHKRALMLRCARDKSEIEKRLDHLRHKSLADVRERHQSALAELHTLMKENHALHRDLAASERDLAADRERFDELTKQIERCHERMKFLQYDHDYGIDSTNGDEGLATGDDDIDMTDSVPNRDGNDNVESSQALHVVPLRESKEQIASKLLELTASMRELQRLAMDIAENCRMRNVNCNISVPKSLRDSTSDFVPEFPELLSADLLDTASESEGDIEAKLVTIQSEMDSLRKSLVACRARDDAEARLQRAQVDSDHLDADIASAKAECSKLEPDFERIKKERTSLFLNCFNSAKRLVGPIYRSLSAQDGNDETTGGTAFLTLDDDVSGSVSEPFLCSIRYNTMPPMKKFLDLSLQSGGEKALSSLALLLALHSFRRSPFVVLDEIDANLDSMKVSNLVSFLKRSDFQVIIISLKPSLFSRADLLVGVFTCHQKSSSNCVVFNLSEYDDIEEEVSAPPAAIADS
ncbi:structural maintenance of chromosome 1 [Babesia ovis]|uniref:Structural maintenance of chromosomes protein n=1 Tax=Babesia ovis TaxID=5869 RepID=A0A9W5WU89_BABOV|nr:structural maintenance of chromosome 1 [Babesia ovis]